MLETAIFHEAHDVDARLAVLQLNQQVFIDAILQAYMHRVRLTPHHPSLYFYGVLTHETVAALRDLLVPQGWEKRNDDNYELVFHPELNVGIAVASGDEGTGKLGPSVSHKSPKGRRTAKAVRDNQTADLFPETLPSKVEEEEAICTWILLHRLLGSEIHLELSRPNGYDSNSNHVTSWSERILLGSISLGDTVQPVPTPQLPDIDIVISRKSA